MNSSTSTSPTDALLPSLPSGRPRRLLLFLPGLQPDDLLLRAFDLARHVHAHGKWFARVISPQDGPARSIFEAAAVPVQVIDAVEDSLAVARQVWGAHQDAAIAFGNADTWAGKLAERHGWPLLCEEPMNRAWFDPFASPRRREELRTALDLTASNRLALAFATEGSAESDMLGLLEAGQTALGKARSAEWQLALVRSDGRLTRVSYTGPEKLSPPPASVARSDWVAAADAILNLDYNALGYRPLLDAAALAVPIVADPTPSLCTFLPAPLYTAVEPASPTEIADALIDLAINPEAKARRVASAHVYAMTYRNPARLLPLWISTLEAAVAAR